MKTTGVQVRLQGEQWACERVMKTLLAGYAANIGSKSNGDGTVRVYGTITVCDEEQYTGGSITYGR